MKIKEEKLNDTIILIIEGEININSSPELRKHFSDIVEKNNKKILLDCTNLTYLDSSGLATLIELLQRLKKIDGVLGLCGMNQKVKNIFEITKLINLFKIFENRQQALEGF